MDRGLIRYFWDCGDSQIIEFAMIRARLNRREKEAVSLLLDECYTQEKAAVSLLLDECYTQEKAAEVMDISVRNVQKIWYSAADKLLSIPWVVAYAKELKNK